MFRHWSGCLTGEMLLYLAGIKWTRLYPDGVTWSKSQGLSSCWDQIQWHWGLNLIVLNDHQPWPLNTNSGFGKVFITAELYYMYFWMAIQILTQIVGANVTDPCVFSHKTHVSVLLTVAEFFGRVIVFVLMTSDCSSQDRTEIFPQSLAAVIQQLNPNRIPFSLSISSHPHNGGKTEREKDEWGERKEGWD